MRHRRRIERKEEREGERDKRGVDGNPERKKESERNIEKQNSVSLSLQCEGGIVSVSHFSTLTQSLVVYATTQGKIHLWDLRTKREAALFANPLSLGVTQDLLIEPQHNWLTTGTSRGFLCVWDLRYGVPLRKEREREERDQKRMRSRIESRRRRAREGNRPEREG